MLGALAVFIVAVGVAVVAIGSAIPRGHVATVRARYAADPAAVWAVMGNPLAAEAWRKDIKKLERLPDRDGNVRWKEVSGNGTVTFVLVESTPARSMITRIDDDSLPFGGQWEWAVLPSGAGTELTVTERGVVKPAFFRFMARYFFGYTATMEASLRSLGTKLGESVTPEVLATGR